MKSGFVQCSSIGCSRECWKRFSDSGVRRGHLLVSERRVPRRCIFVGRLGGGATVKARAPKPFVPSEDHESLAFVGWLELLRAEGKPIRFSHIPNETPTSPIQAKRLQRMGVRRGVPDYVLIIRNRLIFIELKRSEGGVVSGPQKEWIAALNAANVGVYVCNGAREAKQVVSNLLDSE